MKKLLNTLYVTTQDTYLRKEGETVVVEKEKQVLLRLPIHTLQGIVTFGNVMTSPPCSISALSAACAFRSCRNPASFLRG